MHYPRAGLLVTAVHCRCWTVVACAGVCVPVPGLLRACAWAGARSGRAEARNFFGVRIYALSFQGEVFTPQPTPVCWKLMCTELYPLTPSYVAIRCDVRCASRCQSAGDGVRRRAAAGRARGHGGPRGRSRIYARHECAYPVVLVSTPSTPLNVISTRRDAPKVQN